MLPFTGPVATFPAIALHHEQRNGSPIVTSTATLPPPTPASPGEADRLPIWRRASHTLRPTTLDQRFMWLLIVIFIAKAIIITFVHAPYSGHDEVAHYAYLQIVAEEHRIPVLPDLSEWQQARRETGKEIHDRIPAEFWEYCNRTTRDWSPGCKDARYPNPVYTMTLGGSFYPTGWIYTANHPPLYYLVMTPVYWLTSGLSIEGQLYALRLAAIPFGIATVVLAWLTARLLFGNERFLTLAVPIFVAFQPQIAYESAMLNNDILAIATTSMVMYLVVKGLKTRFPLRTVVWIGFFLGLALLSKSTAFTIGITIALAFVLGLGVRSWRSWLGKGALVAAIAGALVWPWELFMLSHLRRFHCPRPHSRAPVLELPERQGALGVGATHQQAILLDALARNLG